MNRCNAVQDLVTPGLDPGPPAQMHVR